MDNAYLSAREALSLSLSLSLSLFNINTETAKFKLLNLTSTGSSMLINCLKYIVCYNALM